MFGAYILIIAGVAVWSALVPIGKRISDGLMNRVTVFGGAFLLAVCILGLVPEIGGEPAAYAAVLVGFVVQQLLGALSAHAEHGHTEHGFTVVGLMTGLCLHAFLEGMPIVEPGGALNHGLLYGIAIHNIPVALILVSLLAARGYGFWRVLALLALFGSMSPLGSIFNLYIIQPDEQTQNIIIGLVVGVLLHVSSSILFDHKEHPFSWANLGITVLAFLLAAITIHH